MLITPAVLNENVLVFENIYQFCDQRFEWYVMGVWGAEPPRKRFLILEAFSMIFHQKVYTRFEVKISLTQFQNNTDILDAFEKRI